jgi:hypothetical protein
MEGPNPWDTNDRSTPAPVARRGGPPVPRYLPAPASNDLGLAGFIVSLLGLVLSGGLLCPVGLVLSAMALRREPRGFAVAGFVIGLVGTLMGLAACLFSVFVCGLPFLPPRSSRITNPDGSVVFEMNDAEVPASWSQLATDIMVSKYFRKAGVPQDGRLGGAAPGGVLSRAAETRPIRNRPPAETDATANRPRAVRAPGHPPARRAAGATGARPTATSTPPKTPRRSTTNSST